MTDNYRDTATRYDELNFEHAAAARSFIADFAAKHDLKRICDYACGTGSLIAALAELGHDVYGCDLSEAMCAKAESKVRTKSNATVSHGDMVDFQPPQPVDLATCLFDSINYLSTPEHWQLFFRNVASALTTGGYFIFDFVTEYDLQICWPGYRSVFQGEDWVLVRLSTYHRDREFGTEQLVWHVYNGDLWQISTEIHVHYTMPLPSVLRDLAEAGFTIVELADADSGEEVDLGATTRVLVVARKGAVE